MTVISASLGVVPASSPRRLTCSSISLSHSSRRRFAFSRAAADGIKMPLLDAEVKPERGTSGGSIDLEASFSTIESESSSSSHRCLIRSALASDSAEGVMIPLADAVENPTDADANPELTSDTA